jgi:hypothetical protein
VVFCHRYEISVPSDIAEMKARGYESHTIDEAEVQCSRGIVAGEFCQQIREAFAGVVLGAGIGLGQALALDDYADKATQVACRARDEKEDWSRIPSRSLHDSFAFFDAAGMCFHLPAYMIGELTGDAVHSPAWTLTGSDRLSVDKFSLLSSTQRAVVRSFLKFVLEDPDHALDRDKIQQSLDGLWKAKDPN